MQTAHIKGPSWAGSLTAPHLSQHDDVSSLLPKVSLTSVRPRKISKSLSVLAAAKPSEKTSQSTLDLASESKQAGSQDAKFSVKSAVKAAKSAVETAPVETVGTAVVFSGAAVMSVLMSDSVLRSIDGFPLVPAVLQVLGVTASSWLALRYVSSRAGAKIPSSPIRALSQLLDRRPGRVNLDLSEVPNLDDETRRKLKALAEERDSALAELDEVKDAAEKMLKLAAEKEALEAVAMQLAGERDEAMGEVRALKGAVDAMTERMRAIEAMLAQEVGELRQQNQALETVALQLASERDVALVKVEELQEAKEEARRAVAERDAVQLIAAQLADERDAALAELKELQKVVANLRFETASGLTPEAEVFLKTRVRELRAKFVGADKSAMEQPKGTASHSSERKAAKTS